MKHLLLGSVLFCAGANAQKITFDDASAGAVPSGWSVAMTHKGGAPR